MLYVLQPFYSFTLMLPAILVWLLPHFTDEEAEAQRATYPRAHRWGETELGFEPGLSGPGALPLCAPLQASSFFGLNYNSV